MKYFNLPALLVAVIIAAGASLLFADALVDNHEDGTNANDFECYWYYYDDNGGVKKDDRPQADASTQPSVILVPYVEKNREAFGNKSDTWKVKEYTFKVDSDATGKFATMPFKFGSTWKASYGTATPYVGIGTQLASDGKSIDLTGATEVTFKIRSRVQELTVDFKVEQLDITMDSTYAFYQKPIPVTTTWTEQSVALDPTVIQQPSWTPAKGERPFDIKNITKLAWEVAGGKNTTIKEGQGDTLDIDDIIIKGDYVFISPSVKTETVPMGQTDGLFANFEGDYPQATPLRTYFYAYNDHEIGGNSKVTTGATLNETTKLLNLEWVSGSGSDGVGKGPFIEFVLGKAVKQFNATTKDTVTVQGFVGIGFNVYDSATATYFDATTGKRGDTGPGGSTNSLYFEYLYDGDPKYMTLEISDINDVGDKDNPTRKDSRGQGIVWYRNFPKTGGVFKAVKINFSELVIHDDWKGYKHIPLDIKKLAKVQFKVQGAEGNGGGLYIDNICFPGLNPIRINKGFAGYKAASGFRTLYRNGAVNVLWDNAGSMEGKISLVNTKGIVVKRVGAEASGDLNVQLHAGNLPTGMYFVQFNGTAGGKAVSKRSALTIVK